jgi:hypothetical protein
MSEPVLFARSAMGGKRTARIEARVTDETKFALAQRCHQIGMTESDFITNLVELSLFGYEHVASVQQDRLRMACGSAGLVPSKVTEG